MRDLTYWTVLSSAAACGTGLMLVGFRVSRRVGAKWFRSNRTTVDTMLYLLAIACSGSMAVATLLTVFDVVGLEGLPTWEAGLLTGLSLLVLRWASSVGSFLFRWASVRPLELWNARMLARSVLVDALGFLTVGSVLVGLASRFVDAEIWAYALMPLLVALIPIFDTVVKPWLLFFRSGKLSESLNSLQGSDLQQWLYETATRHNFHHPRLVTLPGGTINAFAVGLWAAGSWIVIGEGILKTFNVEEVRAIVAHELAHLIRRDVPKLVCTAVFMGTLYTVVAPLFFEFFDQGQVFLGMMAAGLASAALLAVVPGFVSRRLEFGADQMAVALTGDVEGLTSALIKLAKLKEEPLDREYLTHPSTEKRIENIHNATR